MGAGAGLVGGITAAFAAADAATVAAIGVSLTTVFEVTAAVGAGLSVIGAVTHNKILTDVGLGLGVIGGIGSLAGSVASFGVQTAASTADAVAGTAAETGATFADSLVPATTGTVGGVIESGAWDAANGLGAIDSIASGSLGQAFPTGTAEAPPTDLTTLNSTAENVAGPRVSNLDANGIPSPGTKAVDTAVPDVNAANSSPLMSSATSPPSVGADAGVTPANTGASGVDAGNFGDASVDPNFAAGKAAGSAAAFNPAQYSGGSSGFFSGILDFAKKNPAVTLGAIQAGGSFLSGATSQLTPAQIAYYNANAANNQAQANLLSQQQRNLAMPKATATLSPVTGAPQPLTGTPPPTVATAQPVGLMNQPLPKLAAVTGAVA